MMRAKVRWFSPILALVACGALQLSCTPKTPTYTINYAEQRAALDNGLRMVIIPDKNTPMGHGSVRYEVGSTEDPEGKAGLAHLVEHMMFQHRFLGPDKPATFDIIRQIAIGYNAFTSFDYTHYWLEGRKEDLDDFLRLEAARMNAICDTIPPEQFIREREVVRNEIQGRSGTPDGRVPQLILDAIYPDGHAYNQSVGGDDKQISDIKLEDVCTFLTKYYTPERATVIVVGNVDPADVGKKIKFAFGKIAKRPSAPRKVVEPLPEFKYKVVDVNLDTERSSLLVMWRLPARNSPDWPAAQTMMGILNGKLRWFNEDWDFAASVVSFPYGGDLAPVLVLAVELYDAKDKNEALGYVWKATKGLHRGFESGVFGEETKAVAKAARIKGAESLSSRALYIADRVQFEKEVDFGGTEEYFIHDLEQIDKLSGSKFGKFMKGSLKKKNAIVLFIKSDKKGLRGDKRTGVKYDAATETRKDEPLVDPAEANRALPAPETKSILSSAERYTLGNGMKVVLLPYKAMPIVSTLLMFNVGSAHEPPAKAGLASVAAGMLAPPRGASIWRVGVDFGGSADADHTWFYSRGIEIYLNIAIKGLERNIKAGEHNQKQIERWQKVTRDRFKSEQYRRKQEFNQLMKVAIYGPEHPYATTGPATKKSVGRIGRDNAMSFKNKHYTAKNATIIVVGSFDPAKAKSIIKGSFGDWGGGHKDEPVKVAARVRTGPEYFAVIEPKEGPMMSVSMAYPAPAGIDADHAARTVLAGMLNQRLWAIRSELGATYGTYAGRRLRVGPSAYVMRGSVDSARAGEALAAMRDKIDSLRRGDDFDTDFVLARRVALKKLLEESTDSLSLASGLSEIAAYDLAPDYYDQQVKAIAEVTPAQVKALIAKELKPEYEIIGCMADRPTLVKAFEEAGIDNVRFVEAK